MKQQFLETGEVVSTHGIRGEIKVLPWADGPEFLLQFTSLRIGDRDFTVERSRVQNTCVLLKLEGIDTVEQAMAMRGKVVYFDRTGVTPEDGYFIADLIGLSVLEDGREIGKVANVLQYPANDVWVIKGAREFMIPAVKEFVTEICPEEGFIRVRLLEGMDEN